MITYTKLSSEKYYLEKVNAEEKIIRRYQAGRAMRQLTIVVAMLAIFGAAFWFMVANPVLIGGWIDQLNESGYLGRQ